jgi:uncharacterized protein (DUF4415 family)
VHYSRKSLPASQTDWARVEVLSDEEIEQAIAEDADAAPPLDAAFWETAKIELPTNKVLVSLRLDPDILAWFKAQGRGYQSKINAVLRAYVKAQHRQERTTGEGGKMRT